MLSSKAMRVAVTGGLGHAGRVIAGYLDEQGHQVWTVDRHESGLSGIEHRRADLADRSGLGGSLGGCEAVVHFASLRSPYVAAPEEVFSSNAAGAFNLFEAARRAGARLVIAAGSYNALGYFFGRSSVALQYLPVDERHPVHATDPYSFGKQVVEDVGRYAWNTHRLSNIVLRLPMLLAPDLNAPAAGGSLPFSGSNDVLRRLLSMPEPEARGEYARLRTLYDHRRRSALDELKAELLHAEAGEGGPADGLSAEELWLCERALNLFSFLHLDDLARLVDKALGAEITGSHAVFVSDKNNTAGVPSEDLARIFYPDTARPRGELEGTASLVNLEAVSHLLDFEADTVRRLW